jgi:hypothetical protein
MVFNFKFEVLGAKARSTSYSDHRIIQKYTEESASLPDAGDHVWDSLRERFRARSDCPVRDAVVEDKPVLATGEDGLLETVRLHHRVRQSRQPETCNQRSAMADDRL